MSCIVEFIKKELSGWGKYERIIFPAGLLLIALTSFILGDSLVALGSALCGISYTIFAGKGKISCYFFGLLGVFCYSYISFKNAFWGNLALYVFYCFPMQILGIFKWKSHLKKDTMEIYKTKLTPKEKLYYSAAFFVLIVIGWFVLVKLHDSSPLIDSVTSVLSILGLLLTVKRCIEQWYVWITVNCFSIIMWTKAYLNGSNCFATILMWITYLLLGIYFLHQWKKEEANQK